MTGEIRILHSVHAADIGRLINPMQCRGQLDGAIAMAFGWALTEKMVYDGGAMVNPTLRNYRIPAFADVPPSEVFFADTYDRIGPLGAKSQGECCINPIAPAIANALADATGVRFPDLPFTPDRIFGRAFRPAMSGIAGASGGEAAVAKGPVTIVTQTRVRPESADAFAALAGRNQQGHCLLPRLHRNDGDAAEPAGAGRLGHPDAICDRPGRDGVAQLGSAAARASKTRRTCWSAATTSTSSTTAKRAYCRRRYRR